MKVYIYMDDTGFNKSIQNIKELYNNLTYFDQYGSSLILFIIITIVFFILTSYCFVMVNFSSIKNDWPNQRCNPKVMPFAGLINKPDDMSISDFTSQNFAFCSQTIINNGTGEMLSPLTFVISALSSSVDAIKNSLNSIREMTNKVRDNVSNISKEIMGRLINISVPLQQIIIVFSDVMSKIQGTLFAVLMTVLGSYYSLKALLGAIAELVLKSLLGLVVLIAVCWLNPAGWAIAPVLTALFVAMSIYMTVVLVFLTIVFKIKPTLGIPKLTKCFDKNVSVTMNDGTNKHFSDIEVGDILQN